jgi:predicted ArsR family transcriptional regulator
MEKSKSSEGKRVRLIRILEGKYAVTVKDICKLMHLKETQVRWYINSLLEEGKVYVKYTKGRLIHYALRRGK